jgi:lysozyme
VPTHEPWDQHENINPVEFSGDATDLSSKEKIQPGKSPSVTYAQAPATKGTPPTPSGNTEEDNIAAFLWMIRVCEGTSGPEGYRIMFTGKIFDVEDPTKPTYQYKDHPRTPISASVSGSGLTSSAAGAYQFLTSTWDQCQKTLGLPDFSPASQDKACILLLKQARSLDYVKTGDFTQAIKRTNKIWASLPDSPYNQHPKDYNTALAYYKQGGGTALA